MRNFRYRDLDPRQVRITQTQPKKSGHRENSKFLNKNSVHQLENSPPYENPLVIGHPALREVSTPVADGSELPDNLIRTMNWIAMEDKRKKMNLVPALSAPQLGINKRIIGTGFTMVV